MARKRRAPSPPPPPHEESSSEETSSGEEEEEEEEEAEPTPTRATQKPHQIPKSPPTATAADATAEGSDEESSDSEIDAEAFQLRQVVPSPSKPPAAPSKLESDADEEDEEQGEPSDNPEPLQKKKAKKPKAQSGRKRQATESTPSGKSKKAKAEVEKAVTEPAPSPKAKKAKAGAENTKKAVPDPSPSSKSEKLKRWTTADEIKILEAVIGHVKTNGTQPGAIDLIAAIGDTLDRKNCSKVEMYEKVRNLRQRYEKAVSTGTLPVKDEDLRKFKLSEVAWGANAKDVASVSISQNDAASPKSKKAQATKEKIEGDTKGRSSKKATTTDTLAKSEKQEKRKKKSEDNEKIVTSKETTTADTQIGGTLVRSNREKSDKEKMGGDADSLGPKEATEEMDTDANVKSIRKGLDELQNLYPNLSTCVERIKAQHPCGETLKRAFELIDDEKACTLESKIRKQSVAEVKTKIRRADTKKEVANMLLG